MIGRDDADAGSNNGVGSTASSEVVDRHEGSWSSTVRVDDEMYLILSSWTDARGVGLLQYSTDNRVVDYRWVQR